jgi:hypothetical protein
MKQSDVENALALIEKARKEGFKGFYVQMSEDGWCGSQYVAFRESISEVESAFEFVYSMQEKEKEIAALKIKESMYFKPNRDDPKSKGIITRIL